MGVDTNFTNGHEETDREWDYRIDALNRQAVKIPPWLALLTSF